MYDVTTDPIAELPGAGAAAAERRRAAPGRHRALPFPQPSPLFVGRKEDRARCLRLLEQSPLLLVYGVPGIGKTEFGYRLVADLRATPRWHKAQPVLVRAQPGQHIAQLVAQLHFLVLGSRRAAQTSACSSWQDELVAVARRLDRAARLVFLDGVHHLDPAAVAEVVGYLARRIGASRLLVASRIELALAADTPPPTVVRLTALSAIETTTLAARLAECQGTSAPDGAWLFVRTRGCPRRLHQLLQEGPGTACDQDDELAQTLQALTPASRRCLILARTLDGQLPVATWLLAAQHLIDDESALWTLAHHHLVDVTQWTVPDLVWSALAAGVSAPELRDAHRLAAQLLVQYGEGAGQEATEVTLAAVEHQLAGGEPAAAWDTLRRSTQRLQTAELGSRALAGLPGLRAALPHERAAMSWWAARLLLRQGQLEAAQAQLDALDGDVQRAARSALLAGQIAQRAGQLSLAEQRFRAARVAATTADECLDAELHLTELAALRGQTDERITETLGAVTARFGQRGLSDSTSARRIACTQARIFLLSGQYAAAARVADRADLDINVSDKQGTLLALATLAYSGGGALTEARRTLAALCSLVTSTGAPSAQTAALCKGAVLFTAGELAEARLQLAQAHRGFTAQHDLIPAAASALALGAGLLAAGEGDAAAEQLGAALLQATRSGCTSLVGLASAWRAHALLAVGQTEAALALGSAVTARPEVTPQARALSHYVLWRVYALAGDTTRAAAELDRAELEIAAADQAVLRARHTLEQAEFAAAYGQPQAAIDYADQAQRFFADRTMLHEVARAHLARALALATRRAPAELALAQEAIGVVRALGTRHGYGPLLLGVALVEAALAHHRGDAPAAREYLQRGLGENPAAARGLYAQPLQAALAAADAGSWSGNTALLTRLGLLPSGASTSLIELRSAVGRQLLTADAARIASEHFDLVIDLDHHELRVGATGRRITGRPLMCAVLAHLLTAGTEGADAERLFREVWKGPEYHPLRHRNTIHVALTRLRQLLRELVPERELVETTPSGWRLTAPSRLCTLRCARS